MSNLYDKNLSTQEWIRERNKQLKEKADKIEENEKQTRRDKVQEELLIETKKNNSMPTKTYSSNSSNSNYSDMLPFLPLIPLLF